MKILALNQKFAMQIMNDRSWFMQLKLLTITLLLFWPNAGCGAGEIPPEHQSFFALASTQQHKVLSKQPLEKQIDIYVLAVTKFRPADYGLGFSDDIATHGKVAIPVLTARLRTDPNEASRWALIHVFRDMVKFHYDFRNEKDMVEVLKEVVSSMKGAFYREESERLLKEILSEPKKEGARVP